MKKILIAFFIILILGGAGTAFFFGWVQIQVPPGSYGVIRSKTHGIDPTVIKEGEFRWIWYAILPTNTKLTIFTPKPVEQPIRLSGSLPSGDAYALFAGLSVNFAYEYAGSLSFMIKADMLPTLMTERGIADQEDLEAFERRAGGEVATYAERRLREYVREGSMYGELSMDKLKEDILREYPYVENPICNINATQYPDITLYNSLRKIYEDYLTAQHQSQESNVPAPANRHINSQIRLDELAKYGELLTKYPILLQYLVLEKGEGGKNPELAGDQP
jgi:hypothetical protein